MPEEPVFLTPRRAAGWAAIGTLIVAAVALYFLYGRRVPPLTTEAPADTAVTR
jgi:hypothetical protein